MQRAAPHRPPHRTRRLSDRVRGPVLSGSHKVGTSVDLVSLHIGIQTQIGMNKHFSPKSLCEPTQRLLDERVTNVSIVSRGKGDYYRLGHGTDAHVRKPQLVEGLKGKKVVHVAVGALHCLAVTETGQVRRHQLPYRTQIGTESGL